MKTLSVLLMSVLLCTQVVARGTKSASAVAKAAGSQIVKVYYKSETVGKVEVSISNSRGEKIFTETIHKTNGFMRPYNFNEMAEGDYTVTIQDEYGKTVEKISTSNYSVDKLINVKKLGGENKYLLTIASPQNDDVTIQISDAEENLIYSEAAKVGKEFGKVYNMKNLKNFSIEVMDAKGVLKKVKY